jgi:hypothetical protein
MISTIARKEIQRTCNFIEIDAIFANEGEENSTS